ncbi:MAG: hypothetical protein L3J49_05105 [Desulfobulbaceae bacterium]|nr:hypothetical protein [Desulfobulbaceae bacterium]
MAQMLDLLVIPAAHRSFDFIGSAHALEPGLALPVPQGVFPRFVEKEQGA